MLRTVSTIILATILLSISPAAIASAADDAPFKSATKARDIGGIVLGMNIKDASKLSPMESIGNGGYQTTKGGIAYDVEVSSMGRIYRIDATQTLGRFVVDDVFLRSLTAKLTEKYGPPMRSSSSTFRWSLIELVKRTGGNALPFETNWASAEVQDASYGDSVTVHVKLIDFRIMWADAKALNRDPRDAGVDKLMF